MTFTIAGLQGRVPATAKALADRGIVPAAAEVPEPGDPRPEAYDRPYLEQGHAAGSPQAGLPRTTPLPMLHPGYPQSIALSPQVLAAQIPYHVTAAFSGGSPSDR